MIRKITNTSRTFNRAICGQYDQIVRKITSHSETTHQLVSLQEYVDKLTTGELVQLKVIARTEAFYFQCNWIMVNVEKYKEA